MKSNQVWVCGEILIDLIPENSDNQKTAIVGGGPAIQRKPYHD